MFGKHVLEAHKSIDGEDLSVVGAMAKLTCKKLIFAR